MHGFGSAARALVLGKARRLCQPTTTHDFFTILASRECFLQASYGAPAARLALRPARDSTRRRHEAPAGDLENPRFYFSGPEVMAAAWTVRAALLEKQQSEKIQEKVTIGNEATRVGQ